MVIFQSNFDMFTPQDSYSTAPRQTIAKKPSIKRLLGQKKSSLQLNLNQSDLILPIINQKSKKIFEPLEIQVEPDWRAKILNESAINNAYLDLISERCTQVRKEMRRTIFQVGSSQRQYSQAVERINQVCKKKLDELGKIESEYQDSRPQPVIRPNIEPQKVFRVGKAVKRSVGRL
ncbi:UNKNOWN [Stylonychia lemnae]|uniref:Uncharacterized protein n=1 Tax=Stylonychia lemnae TaxID=5949 RepID=A0A078B5E3_STYLE|nr:UNKNOWN [Stylonychia lemnae]|eukprot:CDW88512.1 UNKNOWN [Stylonychia lemnae]